MKVSVSNRKVWLRMDTKTAMILKWSLPRMSATGACLWLTDSRTINSSIYETCMTVFIGVSFPCSTTAISPDRTHASGDMTRKSPLTNFGAMGLQHNLYCS